MTDLTEQEIVDAIDRALTQVGSRFAASRPKADVMPEEDDPRPPVRRTKKVGRMSGA
jgi:hypothetical protein